MYVKTDDVNVVEARREGTSPGRVQDICMSWWYPIIDALR